MLRTAILAALALVCAASIADARPRSAFHPDCNITMPCIGAPPPAYLGSPKVSRRETRQIARAQRSWVQNAKFGGPMLPPETQKSFLARQPVSGLVAPLADKLASIQSACPGTVAISGVRHTRVRGTNRWSLHTQGKAVDVRGDYRCIFAQLHGWPGGYSIDPGRVRHVHFSYDADGGREWGVRFAHGGHRKHRHRVASR